MAVSPYAAIAAALAEHGPRAAVARLIDELRAARAYHDLFDARTLQARLEVGLAVGDLTPLEELPGELRLQMEAASRHACLEVGQLFLDGERFQEAWMYLRPAGARRLLAQRLNALSLENHDANELIELALVQGVAPVRGFEWLLESCGVCSAITAYETHLSDQPIGHQQAAAGMLLRRVHAELLAAVKADLSERTQRPVAGDELDLLVSSRPELFADLRSHYDSSHLAAVVRFAKVVENRELVRLALDLTAYGQRLDPYLQLRDQFPFDEIYPTHARFFSILLGRSVETHLAFFRRCAEEEAAKSSTYAREIYAFLLARLGQHAAAAEWIASLPPGQTTILAYAPSLLELSRACGNYEFLLQSALERGDWVSYTVGLIEQRDPPPPATG